jgi:hypothetical protein
VLNSDFSIESGDDSDDDDDDDDGDVVVGWARRKMVDTLYQQYQDKRVLTLAYNECALKFKAQRRLAVVLHGNNTKDPRRMYERFFWKWRTHTM